MKSLFADLKAQKEQQKRAELNKALIHYEAKIGGQLFGPVPAGTRREFFCLDKHTWVWHEEWTDKQTGKQHVMTTRYDVRPNGVLKSQGGQSYQKIGGQEAINFYNVAEMYARRVCGEYDRMLQTA